jgi:7,8-dihydropterin-6-yl-methyl-4-(beta-D-ribofuranosyl)aminobenzene 5'-phosphate synthase
MLIILIFTPEEMTMQLKILVDNNTLIDRYFLGEPGVSYSIEIDDQRILFDVGYSDIFLTNGARMGVDFLDIDQVVLSHAHLDHTWGLQHLIQRLAEAGFEQIAAKRPALVSHPALFTPRTFDGIGEIGSLVTAETASQYFNLQLTSEPLWLHPRLVFLGEIERTTAFEARRPIGEIREPDSRQPDFVMDDSALVFRTDRGLVIITGCAHAGICNTVAYAIKVCGEDRVADIIGGFHLQDPPEDQLAGTVQYFKKLKPAAVHACHCTDFHSRRALADVAPLFEVGVGLTLTYE